MIPFWLKPGLTIVCLAVLWSWETLHPFFAGGEGRLRHAGRNVGIALFNAISLALAFGAVTVLVAQWTEQNGYGLLNWLDLPPWLTLILALLLLDAWLYAWHRANHVIPFLWRFHRMHHSDFAMDVTTATRFHLGEHIMASTIRLGLIPLFGISIGQLLLFESLVVANTMFHHANVSIGPLDHWLRLVIVTPDMHKVHHSDFRAETDSNYSTLFSVWDRLARSFAMRADVSTVRFGLTDFHEPSWQTLWGMLKTPLARRPSGNDTAAD